MSRTKLVKIIKHNFKASVLFRYLGLSISVLCILSIIITTLVYAHSGRTDSHGGHYNRYTGEYHYHHGYPAHQHENGVCPYDFDDKTGLRDSFAENNTEDDNPAQVVLQESPQENHFYSDIRFWCAIFCCGIVYLCFKGIQFINGKEAFQKKYGNKFLSECVHIPNFIVIGADGLPKVKSAYGWGDGYTVYLSQSGHCYHAREGCCGAFTKIHIFYVYQKMKPCQKCCRFPPRMEWFEEYLLIKKEFKRYAKKRIDI